MSPEPMLILRLNEVPVGPNDRVFRHARIRALVVWLAAFGVDVAMIRGAWLGTWKAGYVFGPFLLLFLLLTLRFVTARFHPSNWLVRGNESGVYVQYRSYLNFHLRADEPTVLFLSFGEIASARLIRERLRTPDPMHKNTTQTQFLRHIELELSGDTSALENALEAERLEQAPMEKRAYGRSSTLYRDYPVRMETPPYVRIHWDVVPGAKRFLDYLRPHTTIADPIKETEDFTDLRSTSPEELEKRIRVLAQRGRVIDAVYIARKLHRCSLAEANAIVDRLVKQRRAD
jgi:hypothetical protein